MGFLKFPLSSCEMDQLVIIEQHITTSQKIIQLSDEENSSCFDVISEMLLRGVLQDAEVDNCNAYIVTGDFFEFKKWVDLQNEKAQQIMIQKDGIQLSFAPLTANCELLLNEIIEHRDTKGNCDLEYWENRFKQLSFSEDAVLRSQFGILKERNMISIQKSGRRNLKKLQKNMLSIWRLLKKNTTRFKAGGPAPRPAQNTSYI